MAKKKVRKGEGKKYLYAFDLAMGRTGVTIFDLESFEPLHVSSIETNPRLSYGKRLHQILKHVNMEKEFPRAESVVAIERGFSRYNKSTQVIFRVHGVINALFKDCEQVEYPPKQVKETILHGNAEKNELQEKIKEYYPEINFKNEDESDSFAVGLTFLIKERGMKWK